MPISDFTAKLLELKDVIIKDLISTNTENHIHFTLASKGVFAEIYELANSESKSRLNSKNELRKVERWLNTIILLAKSPFYLAIQLLGRKSE